jgi:transcriptional regulator with XRE-family HTH domain
VSDAPAAIPARLLDPRQMRLAAGVTEAQAARLVQRSVATIRRWESGIPHGRPWGRIPEMLARRLQAHYQKQLNQRGQSEVACPLETFLVRRSATAPGPATAGLWQGDRWNAANRRRPGDSSCRPTDLSPPQAATGGGQCARTERGASPNTQ